MPSANPTPHPLDAAARDELARVRDLQQIVRDINWSLIFDCLKYETFTPHAREVLSHASDDLAALLASVRGAEADTARLDWLTRTGHTLCHYGAGNWDVPDYGMAASPRAALDRARTWDATHGEHPTVECLTDSCDHAARAHPPTQETDDAE